MRRRISRKDLIVDKTKFSVGGGRGRVGSGILVDNLVGDNRDLGDGVIVPLNRNIVYKWIGEYERQISLEVDNVDDLRKDLLLLLKYLLKYGSIEDKKFCFKEGAKFVFEMRKSLRSNVSGNIVFKIDRAIHGEVEDAVVVKDVEEEGLIEEVSKGLEEIGDGDRDRVSED